MSKVEDKGIIVGEEFKRVLDHLDQDGCAPAFIGGMGGTGKSVLNRMVHKSRKNVVTVAPTGLAAVNVNGCTAHSTFSIPPITLKANEYRLPRRDKMDALRKIDVLQMDEIGMFKPNMIDFIDIVMRSAKGNSAPFGGVKLAMYGDLLQLPAVVTNEPERDFFTMNYGSDHFFQAHVFKRNPIEHFALSKVWRQTDFEFINALAHIRIGHNYRESLALINRHCYRDRVVPEGEAIMRLVPRNNQADVINSAMINGLKGELKTFTADVDGEIDITKADGKFPAPAHLNLKVDAFVMFTVNSGEWVNGTCGHVRKITDHELEVELKNGTRVLVPKAEWDINKPELNRATGSLSYQSMAKFRQFPIRVAYANTIHKTQGATLDQAIIDLGEGAFSTGQAYVALSRVKTMDGLFLKRPLSMRDVIVDQMALEYWQKHFPSDGVGIELAMQQQTTATNHQEPEMAFGMRG